ncbi:MAG: hypothetical protein B1H11_04870 [Desulfobacteraceae bacterium 4484_190.1]|nr:MAG: hypothetical protein B1H11_04870 [Desulfobacteraceae bacterium 4484_190.1]
MGEIIAQILTKTSGACVMNTDKKLFLLDVDNIQGYIFDTNKLRTIIGASWIIDHINAADDGNTLELLKKNGFGSTIDDIRKHKDFIYSSGGNTKIIFDSFEKAQKFETAITYAYARYEIPVTTYIQTVDDTDFINKTLIPAETALAQKKYSKAFEMDIPASPYFKICELCGKRYASEKSRKSVVCNICKVRYDKGGKKTRLFPDYTFVTNMEKMRLRSDMVALVVMDGNRIGEKIAGLDSIEKLQEFAAALESIIKDAFDLSLDRTFPDEKSACSFGSIRPLIMGGDDLCFIIDAANALNFVNTFTQEIAGQSQNQNGPFGRQGVQFSTGILFAKRNYPFNFAYRIAHSLLRSAKRYSREHKDCSAVDFHFLLTSSGDEIEKVRENEYRYGDHFLTAKPYLASELDSLRTAAVNLRLLSKNKIKSMRKILRLGRYQSTVELLKYAIRMDQAERKKYRDLLNSFGWRKHKGEHFWRTRLLDLAELTDMVRR